MFYCDVYLSFIINCMRLSLSHVFEQLALVRVTVCVCAKERISAVAGFEPGTPGLCLTLTTLPIAPQDGVCIQRKRCIQKQTKWLTKSYVSQ